MNRGDFLNSIFAMFSKSFTDANKGIWLEAYKKVLPEKIDFDALYDSLIYEYDLKTAPSPAWLSKKARVKQGMDTEPKSIETENIYADTAQGYTYCFSWIKGESSFGLEAEKLVKMGLCHIRKEA